MAAPASDSSPAKKTKLCEDPLYNEFIDGTVEGIKAEPQALSLLYTDHVIKEEMVIGPTEIPRPVLEPTCEEPTTGPSNEPPFAVIVDDQADVAEAYEGDREIVTIGCDDGSDLDQDSDGDIDVGSFQTPATTSRLIDSAVEDAFYDSPVLNNIDTANDNRLTDLLAHSEFDWMSDPTEFTGLREEFTGVPGPTFPVSELAEPVDCFLKMVEPHFVETIVTQTNRYARKTIDELDAVGKLSANSRLRQWHPTTTAEVYRFLALLIGQGLYPNPVEQAYWSGVSSMALFQRTMSYGRFILLKKFMHFADNSTPHDVTTGDKRLRKIQPVIDYFRQQFKRLYLPFQEVAIDESLLKWKGLLSFVQKISTKAAQVGIKTYELCDINGYLWDFFYYMGSKDRLDRTDEPQVDMTENAGHDVTSHDMSPPSDATASIVIDLAKPLFGKGHTIVMDNFYNSPLLARYLKKNQCDAYGTLRLNRQHVPDSLRNLTRGCMNPGDMLSSNTTDLTVVVWRDTGLVSMISTYHKPEVGHQVKYGKTKYKPAVILDYNKSMGGVDRKDQILSAQPLERSRNLIWYNKVFRRLLNTAIFNSQVIYQFKVPKISQRTYREQIMTGLLRRFPVHRPEPKVVTEDHIVMKGRLPFKRVTVKTRHFPIRSGLKSGSCVWCSYKKKNKSRTKYKCRECDVGLCIDNCFEEFHDPKQ